MKEPWVWEGGVGQEDERRYKEHHWDEDLMMSISSHQMQKSTTEMLVDSFVSCVGILCCLL